MDSKAAIAEMWSALITLESYIHRGLPAQLKTADSISGEDMPPVWDAQTAIKNASLYLPDDVFATCESALQVAVNELRRFLDAIKVVSARRAAGESDADALAAVDRQLDVGILVRLAGLDVLGELHCEWI